MSREIKLWCWVHGDGLNRVFLVRINPSAKVHDLKEAILAEKPSFERIVPDSLELFKFKQPLESFNTDIIKLEDGQLLTPWKRISDYWEDEPKENVLSVILPRPAETITSSSSQNSNLSQNSVPPWLVEIHKKLWGKRDSFDQIFRTVNLTETDFIELQGQLQSLNPSRNSESYNATSVLDTKAEFLRSRSFVDIDTAAHFAKYDAGSNGDLVPQLIVNTSKDLTPPIAADVHDALDTDTLDVCAAGAGAVDDAMDVDADHDSIVADATYLSKGCAAIFPCTIRYMDLTVLELEHLNRVPHLMLIRDEWRTVVDIFNNRQKGILGSAVFTGQPGIGKTCLMYYILILCMIRAQPVVFQDMRTQVFLINDEVQRQGDRVAVPGKDFLALVDADMEFCIPSQYLFDCTNLRILLTSSPRLRADKWLTQCVMDSYAAFVMEPWSQKELLVTSLFLAGIDITLGRFRETTRICGYIPRRCFEAAVSPEALSMATEQIINAIHETPDLANVISTVYTRPIHRAFEIYPSPEIKNWECCLARPVSDWAACQMVAELERQGADSAFNFYRMMKGTRDSAPLVGKLFETKVHKFFRSITEPRSFQIYSLDDHSITFNIEFSSGTSHQTFGANQEFTVQLASSVKNSNSCYLKPLSPIFPTFDSFLYQHEMSRSGCQPLLGFRSPLPLNIPSASKVWRLFKHVLNPKYLSLRPFDQPQL